MKKKTILTLALLLGLTTGMTGCSSNSNNTNDNTTKNVTTNNQNKSKKKSKALTLIQVNRTMKSKYYMTKIISMLNIEDYQRTEI